MPTLTPTPGPRLPRASRLAWATYLFVFGLLLASYPARNPDIWGHLAAGRDAWTTQRLADTVTPLFDVLAYAGDAVGGGALLVFVKAAGLGLLGVALFEAARGPSGRLLPAAVVGLALLAVSLRANLQPQSATYLLLGVTSLWLTRDAGPPTLRGCWPLAALFVAWANLDPGVVYGLAAVALTLLGRYLDGSQAWGRVGLLSGALAVACLLNPALRLGGIPIPVELRWLADGKFTELARTPLSVAYLGAVSDSPAALAYYPLLALSLLGFLVNRGGFRWGRLLPSAAFALLSGLTDRAVPLFAIVAAPAAALNLGEALAARRGWHPGGRWVRVVPALPALVAGLFLVAAWPGWLQRSPYEPRRWAYDLPTGPAAAAASLRGGATGAGRTLHLTAESRAAIRWFCPTDDGFHDPRLVVDLVEGRPVDEALRDARVTRVVVDTLGGDQARPALNVLLRDRHRWPLVDLGGGVAVFGWRDPALDAAAATGGEIDLMQLWQVGLEGGRTPVPLGGPAATEPGRWRAVRAAWTTPRRVNSPDRDEAALLMTMAELSQRWVPQLNGLSWYFEQSAGAVGGAAGWASPASAAADAALRLSSVRPPTPAEGSRAAPLVQALDGLFNYSQAAKDDYLSGALAASIRAGRRAVAADPDDPRAHLTLGEAYLTQWLGSGERVWGGEFKQLRELRQAQAVAALQRAVRLSATPPPKAHRLLALVYRRVGYFDLALEHLTEANRAERSAAPGAKPDPEAEADFGRLRDRVAAARTRFDKESVGLRAGDQAALATELGLNGLALELLLKSDVSAFGAAGLRQQLEHMVRTGGARLVTEWTSPDQVAALGPRSYHWLRAQAFAALGDYDAADAELVEICGGPADLVPDPALLAASAAAVVAKNALGQATLGTAFPDAVRRALAYTEAEAEWRAVESRLRDLAEVSLLRGVLALEVGDRPAARRHANAALFFTPPGAGGNAALLHAAGRSLLDRARDPDAPRP